MLTLRSLILDVGGGSAEFILGHGSKIGFAQSFPLGTVRLMEKFPHGNRPTKKEYEGRARVGFSDIFLRCEIRPQPFEPALSQTGQPGPILAQSGTGGTVHQHPRAHLRRPRWTALTATKIDSHHPQL